MYTPDVAGTKGGGKNGQNGWYLSAIKHNGSNCSLRFFLIDFLASFL